MCGINGLVNYYSKSNKTDILSMNSAISHRGPDGSGTAFFELKDNKSAIAFGHVRLSIIDLSHASDQPFSVQKGKYSIVFNGEIFNYKELKEELLKDGVEFKSSGDTEVLLWLYIKHGEKCLNMLRGFFAFCIYDTQKNKLFLARDPFGVKPLKYFYDGQKFAFSSEIKALLCLDFVEKVANSDAIKDFLTFKYIPAPRTILQDIKKLPAGHCAYLDLNSFAFEIERYFTPRFEPKRNISYKEAYAKCEYLLKESINYRLVSDAPLGLFLSGGIDSSLIAMYASEMSGNKLKSFCVGFEDARFDERKYAKIASETFGTEHFEIMINDNDIVNDIENIITNYDEPFADPSMIPSFYLSKFAATHVKAALGGDGGDELFGGYKRYKIHKRNMIYDYTPNMVKKLAFGLLSKTPAKTDRQKGWGKFNRALENLSSDYIQSYALRFSGFSAKTQSLLLRSPLKDIAKWHPDILKALDETGAKNPVDRLLAIDQLTFLPEYILTKTDIATMSSGLEGREPLLDVKLAKYVNSMPANFKDGKKILKDMLLAKLPKDFVHRKKAGFTPPMQTYSHGILKPFMSHYMLGTNSSISFLNSFAREKLWSKHIDGNVNNAELIWTICVLGVWLEKYGIDVR